MTTSTLSISVPGGSSGSTTALCSKSALTQAPARSALFAQTLGELREQSERHQGGGKWIGTGGTSPFGAWGYNPEGVRIGQDGSRHRRAVKVWDKREFRDFDDSVELGTRNMKVALRRLRHFTREGGELLLDVDGTVRATADNAGWLDLRRDSPEARDAVLLGERLRLARAALDRITGAAGVEESRGGSCERERGRGQGGAGPGDQGGHGNEERVAGT